MWMARRYNWVEPIQPELPSPAPTVNGTNASATSSTCELHQPETNLELVNSSKMNGIDPTSEPEVPLVDAVPELDHINGKSVSAT